jgi:hypothetical protein
VKFFFAPQHQNLKKYSDSTACTMNPDVVVGVVSLARQLQYRDCGSTSKGGLPPGSSSTTPAKIV